LSILSTVVQGGFVSFQKRERVHMRAFEQPGMRRKCRQRYLFFSFGLQMKKSAIRAGVLGF